MREHDLVTYSERHHEWLVSVGKWPKHLPRRALRGTVTGLLDDGVVRVLWEDGALLHHFSDNLAVLP